MILIKELIQKHKSQGASPDLLSTAHNCWIKWQASQNEESREAYPMVNEEFALLTILIGLELNGCEPRVLTHDEFLRSNQLQFSQVYVGNTGVIVVAKPIPISNDVRRDLVG